MIHVAAITFKMINHDITIRLNVRAASSMLRKSLRVFPLDKEESAAFAKVLTDLALPHLVVPHPCGDSVYIANKHLVFLEERKSHFYKHEKD